MIEPIDQCAADAARERVDALTKPLGSLGRIEDLAVQLAAIARRIPTKAYERKAVIVGAADHGVATEGVSAYPQEVTGQRVYGFLAGFAAVNAFSRAAHADVYVADFGVLESIEHASLINARVRAGTRNFVQESALTDKELENVLQAGNDVFMGIFDQNDYDVLALGDMGIANTTSSAAMIAAFCNADPSEITGRGTGINDAGVARKITAINTALQRVDRNDWRSVAREVGGLEIIGLAGVMLAAAERKIPIVLDGVIVAAAALLAAAMEPNIRGYFIAAHLSVEPAHRVALTHLGLRPYLDLNLRLGEATGAVLALPLVESASRMICEMHTFAEAGVSTAL